MKTPVRALVVVVLLVSVVAPLAAHDTWLLPASMQIAVGQKTMLSLTSGEAFPVDDFAIDAKRVTRAEARLAGKSTRLATPVSGTASLRYEWTPSSPGVAAFAVELAPKTLTLAPDKIELYFKDINASQALRNTWAALPNPKQWRESYSKHAASFILVGNAAGDSSWRTPLGMGFEIVPDVDPTTVRAGQSLRVHALRNGKPVSGLEVGFQFENDTNVSFVTTDATGSASMKLTRAGRWLVNATDLRRTHAPGLEWESDFATMTLAVRQ